MMLVEPKDWNGRTLHDVHPLKLDDEQFARWLALNMEDQPRRSIGGTNAAAILGLSPYRTPAGVWDDILRLVPDRPFGDTPRSQRGIVLEPIILDIYAKTYPDRTVQRPTRENGREITRHHATYPFLTAHPDAYELDMLGRGILEVKTVDAETLQWIKDNGAHAHYVVQLFHYMNVCGADYGRIIYFNADNWQMHVIDVARDSEFQTELLRRCVQFWTENVVQRVRPPELESTPSISAPVIGNEAVTKDSLEYLRAVRAWVKASEEKKLAEHAEKVAKETVMSLLERDGIDKLICDGHKVAYMQNEGKETLDEAALFRAYPFIDLQAFKHKGPPSKPYVRLWPAKPNARRRV